MVSETVVELEVADGRQYLANAPSHLDGLIDVGTPLLPHGIVVCPEARANPLELGLPLYGVDVGLDYLVVLFGEEFVLSEPRSEPRS